VEFNFGLGAVAVATIPGNVPEMETADQSNGQCDLPESGTTAYAVFLAKIWETMGTLAINAEVSHSCRRSAPQEIVFGAC